MPAPVALLALQGPPTMVTAMYWPCWQWRSTGQTSQKEGALPAASAMEPSAVAFVNSRAAVSLALMVYETFPVLLGWLTGMPYIGVNWGGHGPLVPAARTCSTQLVSW